MIINEDHFGCLLNIGNILAVAITIFPLMLDVKTLSLCSRSSRSRGPGDIDGSWLLGLMKYDMVSERWAETAIMWHL